MVLKKICAPENFQEALRKGLGRAVGHVRAAPPEQVREALLNACVNYVGYDLQCEGSRVPWLHKMIGLTGEADWYCGEAAKALEQVSKLPEDTRGLEELLDLLGIFAMENHPEVKEMLRRKIFEIQTSDGSVFRCHLPIEIFGVDDLVEILRRYSGMPERDDALALGSFLLAEAETKLGQTLEPALRSAGNDDAVLRAYLRDIENYRLEEEEEIRRRASSPEPFRAKYQGPTVEQLLLLLDESPSLTEREWTDEAFREEFLFLRSQFMNFAFRPNGRDKAPAKFFNEMFDLLLKESDPGRQFCLLGVFAREPMPCFEPRLLKLVESPIKLLRWGAARAFSLISTPEIRAKARELLAATPERDVWESGFHLLAGSGLSEDMPLVLQALQSVPVQTMSLSDVHSIVWSVQPLAKIGAINELAAVMLWIYENSPCSNCRNDSVAWLIGHGAASTDLLEECLDDCDENTCELARQALTRAFSGVIPTPQRSTKD